MSTSRLCYYLNKISPLDKVLPQDLDDLSFTTQSTIYVTLFSKLHVTSLSTLMSERYAQRSNERGMAPEQRKLLEESFERVFLKVALKDLQNVLKWDEAPSDDEFLKHKGTHYRAYEFLLKKLKSPNTATPEKAESSPIATATPKESTPSSKPPYVTPPYATNQQRTTSTAPKTRTPTTTRANSASSPTVTKNTPPLAPKPKPAAKQQAKTPIAHQASTATHNTLSATTPSTQTSRVSTPQSNTPLSQHPLTSLTPTSSTPASTSSTPQPLTPHTLPSNTPSSTTTATLTPSTPTTRPIASKRSTPQPRSKKPQEMDIYELAEKQGLIPPLSPHTLTSNTPSSATTETLPPTSRSSSVASVRSVSQPRAARPPEKEMDIYELAEKQAADNDVKDMRMQLRILKQENSNLKKQLHSTRTLYEQLMKEDAIERFDNRRVNMLKSQNIQLERQVLSLTEYIQNRTWIISDIQSSLDSFHARFTPPEASTSKAAQTDSKGKAEKSEKREPPTAQQLTEWVRTAQQRLQQLQSSSSEVLNQQFFFNDLRKSDESKDVDANANLNMVDICKDRATHRLLEAGKISQTESLLYVLYHQLVALDSALNVILVPHVLTNSKSHVASQLPEVVTTLRQAVYELTNLCVLIPQKTHDPIRLDTTSHVPLSAPSFADEIVSKIPVIAKSNKEKVEIYVSNVVRDFQHRQAILEQELALYRSINTTQTAYVTKLVKSLKAIYSAYETSIKGKKCAAIVLRHVVFQCAVLRFFVDRISSPLEMLVNAYKAFLQERSESTLSILLGILNVQDSVFAEVTKQTSLLTASAPRDSKQLKVEIDKLIREYKVEHDKLVQDALYGTPDNANNNNANNANTNNNSTYDNRTPHRNNIDSYSRSAPQRARSVNNKNNGSNSSELRIPWDDTTSTVL